MSSIYIHIPFCKQACSYCNFHFSTVLKHKSELLQAIHTELIARKDYLNHQPIQTIYLGGGTPSLLTINELEAIFNTIEAHYDISKVSEITLEANPDDLSISYLQGLKNNTPIHRLSIGIQSFWEEDLQLMHRAHTQAEARICIENALNTGFEKLSIDLIYGTPTLSSEHWLYNLQTVFDYQIPHLSCYALTMESKTTLEHQIKTKQLAPLDDEKAAQHFEILLEQIALNGYEQYELSNFCKPPHYAEHNSNYWFGQAYLGIGAGAHSYDGVHTRRWNISNDALYIKNINNHIPYWEEEVLTAHNTYNEYIMTAFRTKWGVSKTKINRFDKSIQTHFYTQLQTYLANHSIVEIDNFYHLAKESRFVSDSILVDLFM